jgi:glycosyltransferase involved in cell wall biosynthesis
MKVSVLIPTINDPYLFRTIDEVTKTASDELEFIIINDGGADFQIESEMDITILKNPKIFGRRISLNRAAKIASGNYLFILDAHCKMSQDWDIKLAESARDKNIAYAVIRDIFPDTWEYRPGWYGHVYIDKEYTEKWWRRKDPEFCDVEEESIAFTGCAWMIKKDRYWELGGYDESLGPYGWDGPEWALKNLKNGGKVILRTDVICGHIFGTNDGGKLYPCKMIPKEDYVYYMKRHYETFMPELIAHFGEVPDWTEKKIGEKPMSQKIKRQVKVNRDDEHITRNDKGEIIKKVIEHFEYVYTDDGSGPSEEEIAKKYGPKAKKISEEIWELKKGKLQKIA